MDLSSYLIIVFIILGVLLSLWVTWPGFSPPANRPTWQRMVRWTIFVVNLVSGVLLTYLLLRIYLPHSLEM